jgi:hypothetical protein
MFMLCSMSANPTHPAEDTPNERLRRQLATLAELSKIGMGLARAIPSMTRGDPVLAFVRISRSIRLIIFMESALADGRYAARMAARAEAPAALADAEPEADGDETEVFGAEADAGEEPEGERLSREYENLDETRLFSRWLDRPLDDVIAHIRGQFAMVERGMGPISDRSCGGETTPPPSPRSARRHLPRGASLAVEDKAPISSTVKRSETGEVAARLRDDGGGVSPPAPAARPNPP